MLRLAFPLVIYILLISCKGKETKIEEEKPLKMVVVPSFNSDSAYWFTEKQVQFGPRVPNSDAHRKTGDFLISKFKSYGAQVVVQEFDAMSFDGRKLFLRNIIAAFNPEKKKRILIAAHWDTRPFADKDKVKRDAPFDGANDGASGVAVIMEMARLIGGKTPPEVGVDLILFDGEDYGEKDYSTSRIPPPNGLDTWWCLGSQYWSKHKHKPNYVAYYGILLDMVGAKGSHFFQEGNSLDYAPKIVDKVWNTATRLGYASIFVHQKQAAIVDDHLYINELAKIPTIDIVHFDPSVGFFGDYHHTQKDNLSLISKETLGAVGNVLMNVIYNED